MSALNGTKILFTCGREPAYARNDLLQSCLKRFFSVDALTSSSRSYPLRFAQIILRAPWMRWKAFDGIVVGFLGQPLVPLVRLFSRKPVLFDVFISLYDTLVNDRQKISPSSLLAKAAFWLDRASCSASNLVIADTHTHAQYFEETFAVPKEKLRVLWVGCDEQVFYPREQEEEPGLVLYYSTFLPLHGTRTVIQAAQILQDQSPEIHFRIIGQGMEYAAIRRTAQGMSLRNIEFLPPISLSDLPHQIARAAVCLGGHFGTSEKARRVIAGKTFQCIAMGKATLVGDNPANHELLTHGQDAWFCSMNDPQALAEAIQTLMNNPRLRQQLGARGRQTFLEKASYAVLCEQIKCMVKDLTASG